MKPTERFSDRVENYVKFRPSYPQAVIDFLVSEIGDSENKTCADIGSGTGIFTQLLLPRFKTVYAVEPNSEMRAYAERTLSGTRGFISVNAEAEETALANGTIDLITVAQAFHWFDQKRFGVECRRILSVSGFVALIWNNRLTDTPFLRIYDDLLRKYATDYNEVNHQNMTQDDLSAFFLGGHRKVVFPNHQVFDLDGLFGRLDSSSYAPKPGSREFQILRTEISAAFHEHSADGTVNFNYETECSMGKVV